MLIKYFIVRRFCALSLFRKHPVIMAQWKCLKKGGGVQTSRSLTLYQLLATAISNLISCSIREYEISDEVKKDNVRFDNYSQARLLADIDTIMLRSLKMAITFVKSKVNTRLYIKHLAQNFLWLITNIWKEVLLMMSENQCLYKRWLIAVGCRWWARRTSLNT